MALYRRKPNVIEAVQFDPAQPLPSGVTAHENSIGGRGHGWIPAGVFYVCAGVQVKLGDWLDVTGPSVRVIPREEFAALYEPFGAENPEEHARRVLRELLPEFRGIADARDHLFVDAMGTPEAVRYTIAAALYVLNDASAKRLRESAEKVRAWASTLPVATKGGGGNAG